MRPLTRPNPSLAPERTLMMKKLLPLSLAALVLVACSDQPYPLAPSVDGLAPLLSTTAQGTLRTIDAPRFTGEPRISGSRIVYPGLPTCPPWEWDCDFIEEIYFYNLSTNTERFVTQGTPSAISGTRIAGLNGGNVLVHDVTDRSTTYITSGAGFVHTVDLSGDRLAYWRDGSLYRYDIGGDGEQFVASSIGPHILTPAVSGDYIAWRDGWHGHVVPATVHLQHVPTGATIVLADEDARQPAISGDIVVWQQGRDDRGEENGIMLYDISTGEKRQLSPLGRVPTVSGNRIAWGVWGLTSVAGVYVHDLSTGTTEKISDGFPWSAPSISGNRVVWNQGGALQLYEYEVSTQAQIEEISELVENLLASGEISSGAAESLDAFATQALAALARDNVRAAVNTLNAMIRYVSAQSGKQISPEAAEALIVVAQNAVDSL
jgi:hypothetical protein